MSIEANYIPWAIAIGIGATLIMDLWNLFLQRAFSIPSLNLCLLGRWLRHMPGGTLRHASITAAPQKPFECAVGWIAHYTIGVMFALVLVVLTSGDWLARPTWPLACCIVGSRIANNTFSTPYKRSSAVAAPSRLRQRKP